MKFNILNTRQGKLEHNIKAELAKSKPNYEKIMESVNEYEKSNLATIDKLKREKKVEARKINGALKNAINAHGPITRDLIGSATKRILGALLEEPKKEKSFINKITSFIIKWIN